MEHMTSNPASVVDEGQFTVRRTIQIAAPFGCCDRTRFVCMGHHPVQHRPSATLTELPFATNATTVGLTPCAHFRLPDNRPSGTTRSRLAA